MYSFIKICGSILGMDQPPLCAWEWRLALLYLLMGTPCHLLSRFTRSFTHAATDPAPSADRARLEVSLAPTPPPSAIFRHRSLLPFTCAFTQVTLTHAATTNRPNSRQLSLPGK